MKILLNIGFGEKDELKKIVRERGVVLGWDRGRKSWYTEVPNTGNVADFLKPYLCKTAKTTDTEYLYFAYEEIYGGKRMYRVAAAAKYDNAGKKELADYVERFESEEKVDLKNYRVAYFLKSASKVSEDKCILPWVHRDAVKQQVGDAIRGWRERGEI